LTRVVIGVSKESMHDLSSFVGISSRLQVESDDARMACLTSSGEAEERLHRRGGGEVGLR
jgi:hypothetical protein